MALRDWMRLSLTDGIGPILIRRIVDAAGGAEPAAAASVALLRTVEGIGTSKASSIHASMRAAPVDEQLDRCEALGVMLICRDDPAYPALLTEIPDPPPVLYVKGTFQPRDLNALAIVGSRRCSYYGREQAERFAALLAGAGFTVISGGARGIDSAAHRGALSHPQGRTIAVLGSGIDVAYPPENKNLFEQIAQGGRGVVVSEYPLETPPLKDNFPRRNRIVSGLSRGVLVIEADQRSGALITARQAIEDHSRPVFAVPGRIDSAMSFGPHKLIREGAVLTANLEDILQNLGPLPQSTIEPSLFAGLSQSTDDQATPQVPALRVETASVSLTDRQRLILSQLGNDPTNVEGLIERTALPAQDVLQDLTLMSLKGVVLRVDGQSFMRGKAATA